MRNIEVFLGSLNLLSARFSRHVDSNTLCTEILAAAIKLTGGDRGTVFLRAADDANNDGTLVSLIGTSLSEKQIVIKSNDGVAGHCFTHNESVLINDVQTYPHFFPAIDQKTGYKTTSILCVPLRVPNGDTLGVIQILNNIRGAFTTEDLQMLQILAVFMAFALHKNSAIESLVEENRYLNTERRSLLKKGASAPTESSNGRLQEIYRNLKALATSESNILIEGESGTGKEVLTKQLHLASDRSDGPFVAVNCAAIPESLFESEFFGVAAGAATGTTARKGKIDMADGGTLFLDEIGEIPIHLQSKLLRVLQEKKLTPLGSDKKPHSVDFRLIAATNRNLQELVERKQFRDDLYYRISVIQLHIPPLRERLDDLEKLCQTMMTNLSQSRGWRTKTLEPGCIEKLKSYHWPGNIRELQNKLEGAMIVSSDRSEIHPNDLAIPGDWSAKTTAATPEAPDEHLNLKLAKTKLEKRLIEAALAKTHQNKSHAAKLLGLTREGLRKAMLKVASYKG
jgi:transcriptional regulator with PAS, ATPase and Fis domain